MLTSLLSSPDTLLITAIGLIIAITVHEFSHALTADHLGDPTPRSQGRVTLNPLAHLDPLGTIMLFLANFGWGKPVPFDPYNLRSPRRDSALISLAGPASNLALAFVLSLLAKYLLPPIFLEKLIYLIAINVSLAIFNLIPVHPLDGAKILAGILPRDLAYEWENTINRYGTLILIALIFPFFGGTSAISAITRPLINLTLHFLL